MKKQVMSILVLCAMIAVLLSGCSKSHVHQTADVWDTDLNNHWKTCTDCGENAEEGAHTLDEMDCCTVCGTMIVDWGDSKSLSLYNEDGDLLKMADYDQDGNVVTETVCTYEHDSEGRLTRSTTTTDGVLVEECTYTAVDGESVIAQSISYMDDGTKFTNDYDAYGNVICLVSYDAEGNVDSQSASEYVLSAEGAWYAVKCTSTEADGTVSVGIFSENGDQTGWTLYDADGLPLYDYRWVYTYDADGHWQTKKSYCDDILTEETIYATVVSDDFSTTFPETVMQYNEDGSKTVTVYDVDDNIVAQTEYDANGEVIS